MSNFRARGTNNSSNDPYIEREDIHELLVKWMWRGFYAIGAILLLSILLISFTTPSFKKLEDPTFNLASEIIAGDDTSVLGRLYIENRSPVSFDNLPKALVQALVSTEDVRFYKHSGVDARALGRVLTKSAFQAGQGGGSTLSMQLAKLLYSDRDFKNMNFLEKGLGYYYRKLSEMITAVKLERAYTKEEIIAMYLNKYDFNYNAYGIRAASEIYFAKAPEQLNVEESATLVGMCNNSSYYNPVRRNEKTRIRRNLVLERMNQNGFIKVGQMKELMAKPLDISGFKTRTHSDGLATYFRATLADEVKGILKKNNVTKADGTPFDVYRDGLKIYTTIDVEMQRTAEEAMHEHMSSLQSKFFRVWAGKDPWRYGATADNEAQIRQRLQTLDGDIRQSDRYQIIRGKILDETESQIEKSYSNFNMSDSDIQIMMMEEKKPGLIETMLGTNTIRGHQADILRQIMTSTNWAALKGKWTQFQVEVRKSFNSPTKMKVFSYNAVGERDTVMTPLDSVRYHKMLLQIGSLGVNPTNGFVKFWVGGISHKYFQYDHVRSDRQVGSTFKPFVYSTAIAQFGVSPCMEVLDVAQTISVGEGSFGLAQSWTPKNSGGYSGNTMTLWDALKESKNTASVRLVKDMQSVQPIREIVREMYIDVDKKYPNGQLRVPKNPAICLGAADLTVFEMAGAYTTFANNGMCRKPFYLRRITDKFGKEIYLSLPESHQALPEGAAYTMQQMLKYNVKGAPGISSLKSEIGGKTGTTNDFKDGWFMGVTPQLVVGTWVGGEDSWIRFLSIDQGQGSVMARPFFAKFMSKLESSKSGVYDVNLKFKPLEGKLGIDLNCGDYTAPAKTSSSEFDGNKFGDEEQSAKTTAPASNTPTTPSPVPTAPNKNIQKPATQQAPRKPNKTDDGFNG